MILAKLRERIDEKGERLLVGRVGDIDVVVRQGRANETGERLDTWNVYLNNNNWRLQDRHERTLKPQANESVTGAPGPGSPDHLDPAPAAVPPPKKRKTLTLRSKSNDAGEPAEAA